jgi:uncharacterized protein YjdB
MSIRGRLAHRGPGAAGWTAPTSVAVLFAVLSATAVLTTTSCKDPTSPLASGTLIGPAGGTVVLEDVTLAIPAGALTEVVDVVIENVGDASYTANPFFIDGTAHVIKPEGLSLAGSGATLTIRYDPSNVPTGYFAQRLQITEREQQQWRAMTQNQVRLQEHAIEAHIERFGTFGVVGPDPDKMQVASVVIDPTSLGLALDETGQLEATALCAGGLPLDREITWSSSDDAIATVDDTGLVTGVAEGSATITAEAGGESATAAVTVAGSVAQVVVSPASFSILEGDTQQLTAEAKDANGHVLVRAFTWSSSDETVATVDANGLVEALLPGAATISATAEAVSGTSAADIGARITSVVVSPATLDLMEGDVLQLTAVAYDARGGVVITDFVWTSSDESVATVDENGVLTAQAAGSVTVTASAGGKQGGTEGGVTHKVAVIILGGIVEEPLGVGRTRQLTATAYDAQGDEVRTPIVWTSANPGIASVDDTGLVTGVAQGTATITAASRNGISASTQVRVIPGQGGGGGGEEEAEGGNNLSWPAVFAEGIGLAGLAVAEDTGVRPAADEGIAVDALPFFWEGNAKDFGPYYAQQGANTWRAEYLDGTGQPPYDAQIYWGDNMTVRTWSASRPIRVEQTLYAEGLSLVGFNMFYLSGQGPTELQGTDGTTASFTPTIYTSDATLRVERITDKGGDPVAPVLEQPTSSEVNVAGRIIYGHLLRLSAWSPPEGVSRWGWYRITFELGPVANTIIRAVGNAGDELTYLPEVGEDGLSSWIDIYVAP